MNIKKVFLKKKEKEKEAKVVIQIKNQKKRLTLDTKK